MSRLMCQMSRVTCHVSHLTCHVSHVMCNFFLLYFFKTFLFLFFFSFLLFFSFFLLFFFQFFGQSSEAIRWRVCYQRGHSSSFFFTCPKGIRKALLRPKLQSINFSRSVKDWVEGIMSAQAGQLFCYIHSTSTLWLQGIAYPPRAKCVQPSVCNIFSFYHFNGPLTSTMVYSYCLRRLWQLFPQFQQFLLTALCLNLLGIPNNTVNIVWKGLN